MSPVPQSDTSVPSLVWMQFVVGLLAFTSTPLLAQSEARLERVGHRRQSSTPSIRAFRRWCWAGGWIPA